MDFFESCECSEKGTWSSGVRRRSNKSFACMNCNGSVKPELAAEVQVITKSNKETFCSCGIPWLFDSQTNCERCGLPVSEERRKLLNKLQSKSNLNQLPNEQRDNQFLSKQKNSDQIVNSEPKESDWIAITQFALSGIAVFGFLYNIYREPDSEVFLVHVINTALLAYTNFLAYPLLLFVAIGSSKKFNIVSAAKRSETFIIFLISPFAVVACELIFRILERLW